MSTNAILFPGQGSQYKGMGRQLFSAYPEITELASEILGYSIAKLCLEDPADKLGMTQYTQPALFTVNALGYFRFREENPDEPAFVAGHSLGEYNALLAADSFSFETGLRLVKKRGELMSKAVEGRMAAVIGVTQQDVKEILAAQGISDIDLANLNAPTQTVLAGKSEAIHRAEDIFHKKGIRFITLNVRSPFHSRYMKDVEREFKIFLQNFAIGCPKIPVIANSTALPYQPESVTQTLAEQVSSSVLWADTIRYLLGQKVTHFTEIGSTILSKMVSEIRTKEAATPLKAMSHQIASGTAIEETKRDVLSRSRTTEYDDTRLPLANTEFRPSDHEESVIDSLGSPVFRQRFGIKYAYVAGAMYRGVASSQLVISMGRAGLIGFFGAGGLSLDQIEQEIYAIQNALVNKEPYGMNLLANHLNPAVEMKTANLFLKHEIRNVEAAGFTQITKPIVLFRVKGLTREDGKIVCRNKILAKVSRSVVASAFMSPPPRELVEQLVREGAITSEQAEMAKHIPMSYDICVEADSGGHTDGAIPTVLLPTMLRLRNEMSNSYQYDEPICMGLAGGIGSPEAAAAAFLMGADFILTGSINQCTVESGTSVAAKDLLQGMEPHDTDYAPAGDMFEIGAKVQVLKKGVFFPARANKLYALYSNYNKLEDIPAPAQHQLQNIFFKRTFEEIWRETQAYLESQNRHDEIIKVREHPKHKMALIFRWYFAYSSTIALQGDTADRANFQIHTGPALGAFNAWVKGTHLEDWRARHVDELAILIMTETAKYLEKACIRLTKANAPGKTIHYKRSEPGKIH